MNCFVGSIDAGQGSGDGGARHLPKGLASILNENIICGQNTYEPLRSANTPA